MFGVIFMKYGYKVYHPQNLRILNKQTKLKYMIIKIAIIVHHLISKKKVQSFGENHIRISN